MSAEEKDPVLTSTELDEAEFATFIADFIGPLAAHLPEAFRQTFWQLTAPEAERQPVFPDYKTFLLTSDSTPAKAFYFSLVGDSEAGYDLNLPNNFYKGRVSPDAMGLILTLYVLNGMLWSGALPERTQRYVHNAFYLLRDLAAEHPEATEIYGAID